MIGNLQPDADLLMLIQFEGISLLIIMEIYVQFFVPVKKISINLKEMQAAHSISKHVWGCQTSKPTDYQLLY